MDKCAMPLKVQPKADPNAEKIIYLDYQSTTPCDPMVLEAMLPYFTQKFGNPHSISHAYGWEAEQAVEEARAQIAKLIGAHEKEIIFTSGATEANNIAIQGAARFFKGSKNHIITVVTEHKCVLTACKLMEKEGFCVTYLPVSSDGLIDLNQLEASITDQTLLVSIMAANNEIGVLQPLHEIGALCRKKGVWFHTDAAQAVGKIPMDVEAMNIDMLSISGHKIYGPKGVGALYVRRKPRVRLTPLMPGGGQERGLRGGTLPTPLCVGLGVACALSLKLLPSESKRLLGYREYFYHKIQDALSDVYLNGSLTHRLAGNLNLSFAYVEGESLMMGIHPIALSSGSACSSQSLEPSYVLKALGVDETLAHTSLRIGFGRYTTQEEVDQVANALIGAVSRLREMSPLYEMVQKGIDLSSVSWASHH